MVRQAVMTICQFETCGKCSIAVRVSVWGKAKSHTEGNQVNMMDVARPEHCALQEIAKR